MAFNLSVFVDDAALAPVEPALNHADTQRTYRVVSVNDPAVKKANDGDTGRGTLAAYRLSSDGRNLVIPEDADVFEIQYVDLASIDAACRQRTPAEELAAQIGMMADDDSDMDDSLRAMMNRGNEVQLRRMKEVVSRGLVGWSAHPSLAPDGGRFPHAAVDALFNAGIGFEIASHIQHVSTLAPFGLASYVMPCGGTT